MMKRIFALLLAVMMLMSTAVAEEMLTVLAPSDGMVSMEAADLGEITVTDDTPLSIDLPEIEFGAPADSSAAETLQEEVAEQVEGGKDEEELSVELAAMTDEALYYQPLQVWGCSVNRTSALIGEPITWTVSATGGNADYAYFFNIFCGDQVVQYGTWQLSPSITWYPSTPGNYYVAAYAVDSRWTEIAGPAADGGLVPVQNPYLPPLSATVTVNKTAAKVGETITWNIIPSGGNGDYAYFYNIFCGNEVVHYGDWQLGSTISWTPSKAGNYYVAGYVVDSRWVQIAQAPQGGLVPVTANTDITLYHADNLPATVNTYMTDYNNLRVVGTRISGIQYSTSYVSANNTISLKMYFNGTQTYNYFGQAVEGCVGWKLRSTSSTSGTTLAQGIATTNSTYLGSASATSATVTGLTPGRNYWVFLAHVYL